MFKIQISTLLYLGQPLPVVAQSSEESHVELFLKGISQVHRAVVPVGCEVSSFDLMNKTVWPQQTESCLLNTYIKKVP